MKKLLKLSAIVLVVALVISAVNVFAANPTPFNGIVTTFFEIPAGQTITSDEWVKGTDFNQQSYLFEEGFSDLSPNCTNCKFTITLKSGNASYGSVTGLEGNHLNFNTYSAVEGNYYLTAKRAQVTLVKSYHFGEWYIAHTH